MGEGGSLRPLCGGKGGKKRCVSKIEREITVVSLNHFSCILLGERGNRHAFHAVHLLLLFSLAIRQFHTCILHSDYPFPFPVRYLSHHYHAHLCYQSLSRIPSF